jgi:hypothetical protein
LKKKTCLIMVNLIWFIYAWKGKQISKLNKKAHYYCYSSFALQQSLHYWLQSISFSLFQHSMSMLVPKFTCI